MFNIYATDYAPVDPITPPCDIVPIFIGYKGENKARCLIFDLTECVETFGDGGFVISFIRQGDDLPYLVTDTDRLDNNAIWIITDTDTAVDGYGMVQLQYIVDDVVCKSALYRTVTFDSNSITGDVPDPYEDLLAQIAAYAAQAEGAATTATAAAQTATTAVEEGVKTERSQRIAADEGLNTRINELMGLAGAPSMANSAAAMTDSSKVYVYTGSEAGYLAGHWYYYNGTEWADGGVYQATAINTDKTLTVENMAADAAVVGDRIDECMAAFVVESTSGSIASFADGADGVPVKDLVVNITPIQSGSGDPSPSNVRAISGWTGANIWACGINIWDEQWEVGKIDGNGQNVSGDAVRCKNYIPINGGFPYYFHIENTEIYIWTYDSNKNYIGRYPNSSSSASGAITFPENVAYIRFRCLDAYGTTYNGGISINLPSTDTSYHSYNGNTYNVSFGSAGTVYGGTLDVTTGMLTVTKAIKTYDGSSSTNLNKTANYDTVTRFDIMQFDVQPNTGADTLCNEFKRGVIGTRNLECFNVHGSYSQLQIQITTSRLASDDVAGLMTFLQSYPLTFCYVLKQPISVQLDPVSVASLLGNNNIFADTGSVASCEYRADTKLYIEKLTTPDNDMVADANITSGSYFMVNNNLYLATANIANGGAITPGTNCTATNLAAALNAINS